jgi:hypothetical protein
VTAVVCLAVFVAMLVAVFVAMLVAVHLKLCFVALLMSPCLPAFAQLFTINYTVHCGGTVESEKGGGAPQARFPCSVVRLQQRWHVSYPLPNPQATCC